MTRKLKTHAFVESERYGFDLTVKAICGQIAWVEQLTYDRPTCARCRRILAAAKRREQRR